MFNWGNRQQKSILMSKWKNSVTNKKNGNLARGELTAKANLLGVALRTEDDLNKRGNILNQRDQGKVGGRPPSTPPLYADIIIFMDTIGEGTDVTTGIDGEYSYLVKRMITDCGQCGVCCTFKCYRIMYNYLFTTVSSLVRKRNRKLNKWNKIPISVYYFNLIIFILWYACLWHI